MVLGELVPWISRDGWSNSSARAPSGLPGPPGSGWPALASCHSGHSCLCGDAIEAAGLHAFGADADAVAPRRSVGLDEIEIALLAIDHDRARHDRRAVEDDLTLKREGQFGAGGAAVDARLEIRGDRLTLGRGQRRRRRAGEFSRAARIAPGRVPQRGRGETDDKEEHGGDDGDALPVRRLGEGLGDFPSVLRRVVVRTRGFCVLFLLPLPSHGERVKLFLDLEAILDLPDGVFQRHRLRRYLVEREVLARPQAGDGVARTMVNVLACAGVLGTRDGFRQDRDVIHRHRSVGYRIGGAYWMPPSVHSPLRPRGIPSFEAAPTLRS